MAAKIMWHHQMKRKDKRKLHNFCGWARSLVTLIIIMGLSWITGLFLISRNELKFLAYIFTILVAFQGVLIFILFVILSKTVREAYTKWWKIKVSESSFLSKYFGDKSFSKFSLASSKPNGANHKELPQVNSDLGMTTMGHKNTNNHQLAPSSHPSNGPNYLKPPLIIENRVEPESAGKGTVENYTYSIMESNCNYESSKFETKASPLSIHSNSPTPSEQPHLDNSEVISSGKSSVEIASSDIASNINYTECENRCKVISLSSLNSNPSAPSQQSSLHNAEGDSAGKNSLEITSDLTESITCPDSKAKREGVPSSLNSSHSTQFVQPHLGNACAISSSKSSNQIMSLDSALAFNYQDNYGMAPPSLDSNVVTFVKQSNAIATSVGKRSNNVLTPDNAKNVNYQDGEVEYEESSSMIHSGQSTQFEQPRPQNSEPTSTEKDVAENDDLSIKSDASNSNSRTANEIENAPIVEYEIVTSKEDDGDMEYEIYSLHFS